jgi:O-succinylbenzoate synthase
MKPVMFIQYIRPSGEKRITFIERPDEIADKGFEIVRLGYALTAEVLSTGEASFAIEDGEKDVAVEVCENGPGVPGAVDRLITGFYEYAKANPID